MSSVSIVACYLSSGGRLQQYAHVQLYNIYRIDKRELVQRNVVELLCLVEPNAFAKCHVCLTRQDKIRK